MATIGRLRILVPRYATTKKGERVIVGLRPQSVQSIVKDQEEKKLRRAVKIGLRSMAKNEDASRRAAASAKEQTRIGDLKILAAARDYRRKHPAASMHELAGYVAHKTGKNKHTVRGRLQVLKVKNRWLSRKKAKIVD